MYSVVQKYSFYLDDISIIPNSLLGDPFSGLAKKLTHFTTLIPICSITLILLVDLVAISFEPSHLQWFRVT